MISTLEKVRKLASYFAINNAQVDPVVDVTINKLLAREYNRILELNTRLTDQVSEFENRYQLKSDDFYRRYEAGELGVWTKTSICGNYHS